MTLTRRTFLRGAGITAAAGLGLLGTAGLHYAAGSRPVDWATLRGRVSGGLALPGEPGFDQAKLAFNPLFDGNHPAAVARCATPDDVRACVYEAAGRLPIAARSGGHSYGGYSVPDGGLVVDVAPMSQVQVRPDGTAVLGAGAKLGDVYAALAKAGRCLPAGSCPTVGISGLTLGGGVGVLARKYGLTCDHLIAAQVVTADGRVRTASADSEPDLFWALRGGGGGNFGIVTSFTFRTEPAPDLTVFSLKFAPGSAAEVFAAWQRWLPAAPPELWSNLALTSGDPARARVGGCFVGTPAALAPLLDDLVARAGVKPAARNVQPKNYLDAMEHFAGKPDRQSFVASSRILSAPLANPAQMTSLFTHPGLDVIFDGLGGAVSTVDTRATAFPHRKALATVQLYSSATAKDAKAKHDAINQAGAALARLGITGGYVNYLDPTQPDWANAYYGPNLPRLRQVANTYDPKRVFGFAQSVQSAA